VGSCVCFDRVVGGVVRTGGWERAVAGGKGVKGEWLGLVGTGAREAGAGAAGAWSGVCEGFFWALDAQILAHASTQEGREHR